MIKKDVVLPADRYMGLVAMQLMSAPVSVWMGG